MTAAIPPPPLTALSRPVTTLRGVGPERATQLARLDIHSVGDLLLHRPRRYEDRRRFQAIGDLQLQQPALTRGKVVAFGVKWFRHHQKSIFELILNDGTGRLHCRWWNLPFLEKQFAVGEEVVVFGKPLSLKPRTIDHPETEVVESGEENSIHLNRITPIYPLTEGLSQRWLRALIWQNLGTCQSAIQEPWPASIEMDLPSRAEAIHRLHFPETIEDTELARQRLAFDEFVELERQMLLRRRNFETKAQALPCRGDNRLIKPFLTRVGFKLTPAQTRVLRELRQDLSGTHPMRRLLQGDVGSGKTVVAACCALMALESGYQVALMAPTEVLAEQHFANFRQWFGSLGVALELWTGSRKTVQSPKPKVHSHGSSVPGPQFKAQSREPGSLFIGTHALIEAGFVPEKLGLVIIDEQHKFGVAQREQLVRKGQYPHLLVMTATPIPRTLGLTVYGDLDLSTIQEMPPGRGRIKTFIRTADKLSRIWGFIRERLAEGRQAFVVYPRIEESGATEIKSLMQECQTVQGAVAPYRVGLLHGRLKSTDKEEVMAAFRANSIQVLLATSLVEVGLDVPNASVLLIENAEQFGLAQLHQLRGRIGRGSHDSYCILVASPKHADAEPRLKVLAEETDGFRIAEADLRLRGPGELLGQQQSGIPKFRFGDLAADWELLRQARAVAEQMVNFNSSLTNHLETR